MIRTMADLRVCLCVCRSRGSKECNDSAGGESNEYSCGCKEKGENEGGSRETKTGKQDGAKIKRRIGNCELGAQTSSRTLTAVRSFFIWGPRMPSPYPLPFPLLGGDSDLSPISPLSPLFCPLPFPLALSRWLPSLSLHAPHDLAQPFAARAQQRLASSRRRTPDSHVSRSEEGGCLRSRRFPRFLIWAGGRRIGAGWLLRIREIGVEARSGDCLTDLGVELGMRARSGAVIGWP